MAEQPKCKKKKYTSVEEYKNVALLLEPGSNKWWEEAVVLVAYSIQRISSRLERLMGTNVIRLTDRKYMRELRQRIEQDYELQLLKKVQSREFKEVERERNLILGGKSDVIPPYLTDHPIFIVNKLTNEQIALRRSKLKTKREKNAIRLKCQGAKWEIERRKYEEAERQRDETVRARKIQQEELQLQYKTEDAKLGLNVLRIHDDSYKPVEMPLKRFLEEERNKMKARSWKVSTPYISDKKDIVYIARQKEAARLAKLQLGDQYIDGGEEEEEAVEEEQELVVAVKKPPKDKKKGDESDSARTVKDSETESRRVKYFKDVLEKIDDDTFKGFIMTNDDYKESHYLDNKIMKLKQMTGIKQIYRMAEDIIIEKPEKEDEESEEEEEEAAIEVEEEQEPEEIFED